MKRILPPILFVIFIVLMWLMHWGLDLSHNLTNPYNLFGLPLIFAGILLSMTGSRLFRKLDTNIMTFGEPNILVTEGVFKYSRNPMYLGFVIALLGIVLLMGAAIPLLLLVLLFFVISDRWYITFEERMMIEKFGPEYKAYCRRVRRWI